MGKDPEGCNNLEEILKKARKLDEEALGVLTRKYYPRIFRFFYYRARTKEDAEDLAGEVFVKVVKAIKSQKGNFKAWLFKIARNLLIDYYRKKGRRRMSSLDDINYNINVGDKYSKDRLEPEDVKKLLEFLTQEQSQVIILKFLQGYTNKEIAEIMHKSEGAVKALQFRALSTLKDILEKEEIR